MIDQTTFQVLDDSVPACSGSHFPARSSRSMSYRTKKTCSWSEHQPASRKTALPDTWTAPVGATRRTASLT